MKYLIINADDFGYSEIFNESILNLITKKLISSTTVMVNHVTKNQKNQIQRLINLKEKNKISIGLHLEFNQNNNNNKEIEFNIDILNQLDKFEQIFKFKPSHIDIHKPSNSKEENLAILKICKEQNLSTRNLGIKYTNIKTTTNKVLNGTTHSIGELKNKIKKLNQNESYEILFHPGTYDKNCKSSLNKQRELDIKKIKKIVPEFKKNQIKLINYYELR